MKNYNNSSDSSTALSQLLMQAINFQKNNNFENARKIYFQILKSESDNFDALHMLGVIYAQTNDYLNSIKFIDKAISLNPNNSVIYNNKGLVLEALNKFDDAVLSYIKSIRINSNFTEAYCNLGNVYFKINNTDAALSCYEKAIELNPNYVDAHNNCGNVFKKTKKYKQAIACYKKSIFLNSLYSRAYNNLGLLFQELKQFDLAMSYFKKGITISPNDSDIYNNLSLLYAELNQKDSALNTIKKAILLNSNDANLFFNQGNILQNNGEIDKAIISYEKTFRLAPNYSYLMGTLLHARMQNCDWSNFDNFLNLLIYKISKGEQVCPPFALLSLVDDPELQKNCSRIYCSDKYQEISLLGKVLKSNFSKKIRIGYFSADFNEHPVSRLMAQLFELHDRENFEIFAFSFQPKDDEMQRRLIKLFDKFIFVNNMSDEEIAQHARFLGIDIAIDLGGYTKYNRTNVFAYRTAPIQISYIGFLGTMASEYIDYIIADKIIIPDNLIDNYVEKIIYLPSYQINDSSKLTMNVELTREHFGLPKDGFVFCSFNNNYKILPSIFSGWLRILLAVEKSVLFMYSNSKLVEINLRREAENFGIDPRRLIFGERIPYEQYLSRYKVCDLFLDTSPYNGGATASDALWTGLPVLTLIGESFQSRIGASLLSAIGLTEMIAYSQQDYEWMAIELALNQHKLSSIRAKLIKNRFNTKLFNSVEFTRNLEIAYTKVMNRYLSNLSPDNISVD